MRLFIAVELERELRERAATIAERIARELGPSAHRGISWVRPDRMHLTIRFLGEVDQAAVPELRTRLAAPVAVPAFRLTVSGVGAFPPSGPPRVIWLGIVEGQAELRQLHDALEARLAGLNVEREDRPYRAHLTLGRVKAPLAPSARAALARVSADALGSCTIDHATLFESRLSPAGPSYTALAPIPLADNIQIP